MSFTSAFGLDTPMQLLTGFKPVIEKYNVEDSRFSSTERDALVLLFDRNQSLSHSFVSRSS